MAAEADKQRNGSTNPLACLSRCHDDADVIAGAVPCRTNLAFWYYRTELIESRLDLRRGTALDRLRTTCEVDRCGLLIRDLPTTTLCLASCFRLREQVCRSKVNCDVDSTAG